MPRILIIGATSTVGRQVVSQLNLPVRALTRNPETANLPSHVETVTADLTLPDTLDAALQGIDTVFLIWTAPPSAVVPALDRIAKHARRIVLLTAPLKTPHPLFQQPNPLRDLYARIEDLIRSSPLEWTFVRPGMFAANALRWWAPQIRAGNLVRWPYLAVPTAPIHEADIAAVAVRALTDTSHAGAEYVITGPQSLSQGEQIAILGRALGRPLRPEEISPDEARSELLSVIPAPGINMLLNAWSAAAGQPAFVTSTVEEITGSPARTFHDWATDNDAEFRT